MIYIEQIEKAYLRFKLIYDNLSFKVQEFKDEKDKKTRFEVRSSSRFISSFEEKENAYEMCEELNKLLETFIKKEYQRFIQECESAQVLSSGGN